MGPYIWPGILYTCFDIESDVPLVETSGETFFMNGRNHTAMGNQCTEIYIYVCMYMNTKTPDPGYP